MFIGFLFVGLLGTNALFPRGNQNSALSTEALCSLEENSTNADSLIYSNEKAVGSLKSV